MKREELDKQIEDFWEWFSENQAKILQAINGNSEAEKRQLSEDMDRHILAFGMLTWEMGPIDEDFGYKLELSEDYYFLLSPNGNKEFLLLTKRIMESAPSLPNWALFASKPPSHNSLKFSLYDEEYVGRKVNGYGWEYIMTKGEYGPAELIICAKDLFELDEYTQRKALDLVLGGLIGEEKRMNQILKIDVVKKWEEAQLKKASPIVAISTKF